MVDTLPEYEILTEKRYPASPPPGTETGSLHLICWGNDETFGDDLVACWDGMFWHTTTGLSVDPSNSHGQEWLYHGVAPAPRGRRVMSNRDDLETEGLLRRLRTQRGAEHVGEPCARWGDALMAADLIERLQDYIRSLPKPVKKPSKPNRLHRYFLVRFTVGPSITADFSAI